MQTEIMVGVYFISLLWMGIPRYLATIRMYRMDALGRVSPGYTPELTLGKLLRNILVSVIPVLNTLFLILECIDGLFAWCAFLLSQPIGTKSFRWRRPR